MIDKGSNIDTITRYYSNEQSEVVLASILRDSRTVAKELLDKACGLTSYHDELSLGTAFPGC